MAQKLFTAIAFYHVGDDRKPCKYRNISNLANFDKFAAKNGFWYSNIYCKETRQYVERRYHSDKR